MKSELLPDLSPARTTIRGVWKWWKQRAVRLSVVFATGATVLAIAVCVQAGMLYAQGSRVNWGTMPAWLSAVGTVVAIVAVLIAAYSYRHDVQVRVADEDRRSMAERGAQAELITGWIYEHAEIGLEPDVKHRVDVGLINASHGVVYDFFVRVRCEVADPASVGTAGPWHREAWGFVHVLAPGKWSVSLDLPKTAVKPLAVEIYFRDAKSVLWCRDANGVLKETRNPPIPFERPAFWRVEAASVLGPNAEIQVLWTKKLD